MNISNYTILMTNNSTNVFHAFLKIMNLIVNRNLQNVISSLTKQLCEMC